MGRCYVFPLIATIMVMLIVLGFYGNINEATSRRNYWGAYVNIDNIINDVIKRLNLNISNPVIRYNLYYSGRVLRFKASDIHELIGISPRDILFGYYYNGTWRYLLMRVYNEKIVTNVTIIYMTPEKIDQDTIIEIKLPRYMPIEVDHTRIIPPFARGAKCAKLGLIDPRDGIKLGVMYLFIGGAVKIIEPGQISGIRNIGINDAFTASQPSMLLDYMFKLKYDGDTIYYAFKTINNKPILLQRDLTWTLEWEPPVP